MLSLWCPQHTSLEERSSGRCRACFDKFGAGCIVTDVMPAASWRHSIIDAQRRRAIWASSFVLSMLQSHVGRSLFYAEHVGQKSFKLVSFAGDV